MKKVVLLLLVAFSLSSFGQKKSDFWDNVRYGGGFTLGFGSSTTIGISPSAIYDFKNGVSLGAGLNYIYSEIGDFSTNVYGGSLISLYQVPKIGIQLSGEYEYSFAKQSDIIGSFNTSFPALYFGLAYNQGKFAFGVRYDVLYDENKSVFTSPISPIVRFYF